MIEIAISMSYNPLRGYRFEAASDIGPAVVKYGSSIVSLLN